MRVLIVGGGVAGLTLAAKLRQQGREPVVIEKAPEYKDIGYGLGLYPLGSCVLHGLGVYDDFIRRGVVPSHYEILDQRGRLLSSILMSDLTASVGPMVMISRSDLIDVLRRACGTLQPRMGITVSSLKQSAETVQVDFSDGARETFDLVVACDGSDSSVRHEVFGPQRMFDTGWALRTWWTSEPLFSTEVAREYWGSARLFGAYTFSGRTMAAVGAPAACLGSANESVDTVRERLRGLLRPWCERDTRLARAVEQGDRYFLWPMRDVRSSSWRKGRVVLCGDAATGFLPTAGVGTSCALRAAASLADELSRTDASGAPLALELYERRVRRVIEANQSDSRFLAYFMFVKTSLFAKVRDALIRVYPAQWAVRKIAQSMRTPF